MRAHLEAEPSEQLSLFEEVALARHRCDLAVERYAKAIESGSATAAETAGDAMDVALARVRTAVKDAVTVTTAQSDKFSVHTLRHIVAKMSRIAKEVFGEDDPRVYDFERRLTSEVKLPGRAQDMGIDLTPDEVLSDVEGMDDSVLAGE